ncbi:MAG: DUF1657 domain-containing protein [Marinisporobacter sp.]|nr:DUF1657 domain-containing protein [Marinisporobacter sp.]
MTVASKVKQTVASLKSTQSTLRLYSIQIDDKNTRAVYEESLITTGEIIKDLEERVKILEYEEPQHKGY